MADVSPLDLLVIGVGGSIGLVTAGHALLRKRRPQAAFGWIAVCLVLPLAGPLLYFLFGINRVEHRARRLRGTEDAPLPTGPAATSWDRAPDRDALVVLGGKLAGRPLCGGNRVEPLHNGEQAFPAMLEAIAQARSHVWLSTYIFDTGRAGRAFADALTEAAARGVDVRVLVDGIGALYAWPGADRLLRGTRVRHARFLAPTVWPPTFHVNLRNHRKILAVDGNLAFTGGMNLNSRSLVDDPANASPVADLHFRVTGPVVAQVETVFLADWRFATGEDVEAPPVSPGSHGPAYCRAIADGPDGELDRLLALLIGATGAARQRLAIMTPYFLPPRELIGPLQATALRGVAVDIVLPGRSNLPYVDRATRHMLWELLQRGVHVYYRPPPFAHTKLMLVDDDYALVGSANIDSRSLRLNFELALEVHDADFVASLYEHFDAVRARSTRVSLADVDGRPLPTRLVDGVTWLFSPYL